MRSCVRSVHGHTTPSVSLECHNLPSSLFCSKRAHLRRWIRSTVDLLTHNDSCRARSKTPSDFLSFSRFWLLCSMIILEAKRRFEDWFGFLLAALRSCTGPVPSRSVDVSVSCRCLLVEFPSPPGSFSPRLQALARGEWKASKPLTSTRF